MLRRRPTTATALALAAAFALAAPAIAQSPSGVDLTFVPARPHKGATFKVVVDGTKVDQSAAKVPSSVRVDSPAGLAFDAAAVRTRCAADAAQMHACPAASKVADGTALVAVKFFGFSTDVTADLTAYLAPATQPGDLAGLVVEGSAANQKITLTGRVLRGTSAAGPALVFNVSGGGLPAGVSGQLKTLSLQAGASRSTFKTITQNKKVKKRVTVNGRKVTKTVTKKVKVRKKIVRHLLTTPKSCPGAWTAGVTIGYGDGTSTAVPVSIPCSTR